MITNMLNNYHYGTSCGKLVLKALCQTLLTAKMSLLHFSLLVFFTATASGASLRKYKILKVIVCQTCSNIVGSFIYWHHTIILRRSASTRKVLSIN